MCWATSSARAVGAGEQDAELVAAEPCHHVGGPQAVAQHLGPVNEQSVTCGEVGGDRTPLGVVHHLRQVLADQVGATHQHLERRVRFDDDDVQPDEDAPYGLAWKTCRARSVAATSNALSRELSDAASGSIARTSPATGLCARKVSESGCFTPISRRALPASDQILLRQCHSV
jgi:hypothetical protein